MSPFQPDENGPAPAPAQNHRLRRGIYLLPGAFTVANLLCGYYAVLATLKGGISDLDYASRAIGFAVLFDALDGWVARATRSSTEFGKQFDSLADVISFGIAPSFLAFAWGVRGILQADSEPSLHVYQFGWVVCFAFLICCAWRLARFNVHGMAPGASRFFVGMPTPAAAGMIAAMVHAWKKPIEDWRWSLAWLLLVASLSALMASTVRYASLKGFQWHRRQHSLAMVGMGLLAASIWFYSEEVLLLVASAYAASGLVLHVVRAVRHRLVSRPA